jgi:1-acyl-sn-glycerol-3-phosphate acyltransferase
MPGARGSVAQARGNPLVSREAATRVEENAPRQHLLRRPMTIATIHPDVDADFRPSVYLAFGALQNGWNRVWHRYELRGTERVPARPCLFVGNHSGLGIADVLCMVGAFRARFGLARRCVGMMQDLFVAMPIVGWFARSFGAVYASPDAARQAFARGYDVACFPGGDIDSCRPFTAHREVHFGDRRGYVRLALATGIPIVPVATIGSHFSYLVLPGGEQVARLARALGAKRSKRFPITLGALGVLLALILGALGVASPWWILAALLAAIFPTPVRVTSEILAPIDVRAATAHIADPAERVEAAHRLVHGALAEAVQTLRHARRTF